MYTCTHLHIQFARTPVAPLADPSELEGCLNVPPSAISGGDFDDNIVITFSTPLLGSLVTPNLEFMDQKATPQSKTSAPGNIYDLASPSQQAKPSEPKPQ